MVYAHPGPVPSTHIATPGLREVVRRTISACAAALHGAAIELVWVGLNFRHWDFSESGVGGWHFTEEESSANPLIFANTILREPGPQLLHDFAASSLQICTEVTAIGPIHPANPKGQCGERGIQLDPSNHLIKCDTLPRYFFRESVIS
jgi:hypothetical protein